MQLDYFYLWFFLTPQFWFVWALYSHVCCEGTRGLCFPHHITSLLWTLLFFLRSLLLSQFVLGILMDSLMVFALFINGNTFYCRCSGICREFPFTYMFSMKRVLDRVLSWESQHPSSASSVAHQFNSTYMQWYMFSWSVLQELHLIVHGYARPAAASLSIWHLQLIRQHRQPWLNAGYG